MKKVSIVVPVYKVEKYLVQCLESITQQTYDNLEIILVDDGSPDACGEICDTYAGKDGRIKVIHQKNGGLSAARNVGLQQATGEYLLFIDSDDWIAENLCEIVVKEIEAKNCDVVVFGSYLTSEEGEVTNLEVQHCGRNLSGKEAIKELLVGEMKDFAWNKLYKRELFHDISFPIGRLFEDVGTIYKVFEKADRICILNRALYYYRQRAGSIMTLKSAHSQMEYVEMCLERYEYVGKTLPELKKEALQALMLRAVGTYGYLLDRKYRKQRKEIQLFIANLEEFLIKEKKLMEEHVALDYDWYVRLFFEHRTIFKLYYKMGLHKSKKLQEFLWYVLSDFFAQKNEKLELSGKELPRCFLIGLPDHDNLGDHAIGLAEEQYLKNCLKGYEIVTISENQYKRVRKDLCKQYREQDIIVLQGGGNLGDEYAWCERIRVDILKKFRNRKLLLFPQTVYFTDSIKGRIMQHISQKVYRKSGAILTAREQDSFDKMKRLFPDNQVYLLPDIVYLLNVEPVKEERQGGLLCLRKDVEASLNWKQRMEIYYVCQRQFGDVSYTDTATGIWYGKETGKKALWEKLQQFSKSSLIVTDRLHGMVFAALTGTPCVVLSNYNSKIKGVYQWIADLNYVEYIDDVKCLEDAIQRLSRLQQKDLYSREKFIENYKILDKILEEWEK